MCAVHWIHSTTIQLLQEGRLLLEERAASVSMTWSIRSSYGSKGLTKNWHKTHHHAKDMFYSYRQMENGR